MEHQSLRLYRRPSATTNPSSQSITQHPNMSSTPSPASLSRPSMSSRSSTLRRRSWTLEEETTLAILHCYGTTFKLPDYPDLLYTLWGRSISAEEIESKLDKRGTWRDSGGELQEASPLWQRVLALGPGSREVVEKLEDVERSYRDRKEALAWLEGRGSRPKEGRWEEGRRDSTVDWSYLAWNCDRV